MVVILFVDAGCVATSSGEKGYVRAGGTGFIKKFVGIDYYGPDRMYGLSHAGEDLSGPHRH